MGAKLRELSRPTTDERGRCTRRPSRTSSIGPWHVTYRSDVLFTGIISAKIHDVHVLTEVRNQDTQF